MAPKDALIRAGFLTSRAASLSTLHSRSRSGMTILVKDKVCNTGTAAGMVTCVERAWSIIPDRLFIADCNDYLCYLFTVVDAEGSFVVDSETRSGRRYQALRSLRCEAEGDERATKFLKRKPRPRQRTATQASMKFHPDLAEMVEILEANRDESKQEGAAAAAVGGT